MIARLMGWLLPGLTPALLVLTAAALGVAGLQTIRFHQKTTELAEFRAIKINSDLAREQSYTLNLLRARQTEQTLNDRAALAQKENHVAVQSLDRRVADLAERLRLERAGRPDSLALHPAASPAGAAASRTGAGLYRDDAQFLVGLSASAARVGLERDECRTLYDAARVALSE